MSDPTAQCHRCSEREIEKSLKVVLKQTIKHAIIVNRTKNLSDKIKVFDKLREINMIQRDLRLLFEFKLQQQKENDSDAKNKALKSSVMRN
ncbi:UNVERIFIED_CONTAM: hypothetical protein NCL1_16051 [Trichonephila clavipes]